MKMKSLLNMHAFIF
jgi:RNA recognition motif-containing protein